MSPNPDPIDESENRTLGSPYGPYPHGTDESAGGADSSPFETVPSDERAEDMAQQPASNQNPIPEEPRRQ